MCSSVSGSIVNEKGTVVIATLLSGNSFNVKQLLLYLVFGVAVACMIDIFFATASPLLYSASHKQSAPSEMWAERTRYFAPSWRPSVPVSIPMRKGGIQKRIGIEVPFHRNVKITLSFANHLADKKQVAVVLNGVRLDVGSFTRNNNSLIFFASSDVTPGVAWIEAVGEGDLFIENIKVASIPSTVQWLFGIIAALFFIVATLFKKRLGGESNLTIPESIPNIFGPAAGATLFIAIIMATLVSSEKEWVEENKITDLPSAIDQEVANLVSHGPPTGPLIYYSRGEQSSADRDRHRVVTQYALAPWMFVAKKKEIALLKKERDPDSSKIFHLSVSVIETDWGGKSR